MAKRTTVDIWVAVDDEGFVGIASDEGDAFYRLTEANGNEGPRSIFHVKLSVPIPAPVVVEKSITDDGETAEVIEAK